MKEGRIGRRHSKGPPKVSYSYAHVAIYSCLCPFGNCSCFFFPLLSKIPFEPIGIALPRSILLSSWLSLSLCPSVSVSFSLLHHLYPDLYLYDAPTASGFLLASYPCFCFISSTSSIYFFSASAGVTPSLTSFSQALYLYLPCQSRGILFSISAKKPKKKARSHLFLRIERWRGKIQPGVGCREVCGSEGKKLSVIHTLKSNVPGFSADSKVGFWVACL
jgi:hypothetical protein